MKKFKPFFFAAVACISAAILLISCSDDDGGSDSPSSSGVDYLVMYYAVGGENLDDGQLANIYQALDAGSSDKVKMTFQFKLSACLQNKEECRNFNGTRRFTLDGNTQFKGVIPKDSLPPYFAEFKKKPEQYKAFCDAVSSECIGDASYVMASDTALQSFIDWSLSLYPDAKNTILILGDHGSGWSLHYDGVADNATRAIEFDDDNVKGSFLSLRAMERAISKSKNHKLSMIYTDACLMATHENLVTYAKVADYAMTAVEVTAGRGGNYYVLLETLKSSESDEASLWNACTSYIDYLNTSWWLTEGYCDLGIYDLRKYGALTAVTKTISSELVSKWNDLSELPVSDSLGLSQWRHFMRVAVSRCMSIVEPPYYVAASKINADLITYIEEADIQKKYIDNKLCYRGVQLLDWLLGDSKTIEAARESVSGSVIQLQNFFKNKSCDEYSIADILRVLNENLKDAQVPDVYNPFITLRSEYLKALKSISYINCTKRTPAASAADYPYEFCGPGIFLHSLNPENYNRDGILKYKDITLADAIRYYQETDFDKTANWSTFLQLIDVTPTILYNPSRSKIR